MWNSSSWGHIKLSILDPRAMGLNPVAEHVEMEA